MYKSFSTIDALLDELKNDMEAGLIDGDTRNRYPFRFILFDLHDDYREFVCKSWSSQNTIHQNISQWFDTNNPDMLLTSSELANRIKDSIARLKEANFIISPFSEVARFYSNKEFYTLMATIMKYECPTDANGKYYPHRFYIPIIGMQSKVDMLKDDPSVTLWEYHSLADDDSSISHKYEVVITNKTTYGVQGLKKHFAICNNFTEWTNLWNDLSDVKDCVLSTAFSIYANREYAFPDNAFIYQTCNNAFDFLKDVLNLNLGTQRAAESEMKYYEALAKEVTNGGKDFDIDRFVETRFNRQDLTKPDVFVDCWLSGTTDEFGRWLLKNYYLRKTANDENDSDYAARMMSKLEGYTPSELFKSLALDIFDEPAYDENDCSIRLQFLKAAKEKGVVLTVSACEILKSKLDAIANNEELGVVHAMRYVTPLTDVERRMLIDWVGADKVKIQEVKELYPELYSYLSPSNTNTNAWVDNYFDLYKRSKVAGKISDTLAESLQERNGSVQQFKSWYDGFKTVKTMLYDRKDIEVFYWIDGLGVDWVPYVASCVEQMGKNQIFLNEVMVARAQLPTVTHVNKGDLNELAHADLPKTGDLDEIAHKNDGKSRQEKLCEEFNAVSEIIRKIISQFQGKKIAIVSDHGISYLAQYGNGHNLGGIESHHMGRYALRTIEGLSDDQKKFFVLEDNRTICSLNHDSLAAKTHNGCGAHGGCTPEEVLVPIFILSNQEVANNISAHIKKTEIVGSNPVAEFIIEGIKSGIDTPKVIYDGREYSVKRNGGGAANEFVSERLTLNENVKKLTLVVGNNFEETYEISVSTGVQENDFFDGF